MPELIRKIAAYVREIPANVDETRIIDFAITSSTKDRHRTVLSSDKWVMDNYRLNPVVFYQHYSSGGMFSKPDPDMLIAKSVNLRKEGDQWVSGVHFEPPAINKVAEKIFQKVKFGSLRAASVGFMEVGEGKYGVGEEARNGKNETYYYDGQELLEFSIVNIPSNPLAIKRDGYTEPTLEEILNKYSGLLKEFDEAELKKINIISLLKHIEGIELLKLTPKKIEKNLIMLTEKKLHLAKIKSY